MGMPPSKVNVVSENKERPVILRKNDDMCHVVFARASVEAKSMPKNVAPIRSLRGEFFL